MSLNFRLICAVVVAVIVGGSALGAGEPIAVEKMVANDAVIAVFMRNGNDIAQRWKGTALAEVMDDPEFKAMIAPLEKSLQTLYENGVPPDFAKEYGALFTGEAALAVYLRPPMAQGPMPVVPVAQLILHPADPAAAETIVKSLIEQVAQLSGAEMTDAVNLRLLTDGDEKWTLRCSRSGDSVLLTLGIGNGPEAAALHDETLQGKAVDITMDKDYAQGKEKLGSASDVWVYVGAMPWLGRNTQFAMIIQPFLQNFGIADLRGISLGIGVEGRGFRSRVFISKPATGPLPAALTDADLAMIPRDVLSFSIASVNWQGLYDFVIKLISMKPENAVELDEGIEKAETAIGMNIRNDILGNLAGPMILYSTEPASSVGQRGNFFIKVKDSAKTTQDLEKLLTTLVGLIYEEGGDQAEAFVRMRRIDRPEMTQLYPQSVFPASFTPNFLISKNGWLGINFSAANALPEMEYFLKHGENVTARKDFTNTLAKMPEGYSAVSYTDTGRCFGNGIRLAQMATDFGIIFAKAASTNGELDLPMPLDELWGMDQGRAPSEALYREKLFGGVSVFVVTPEGMLWENYSAVGPILLPTSNINIMQADFVNTSILAGMLLPALARARGQARAANCMSNLKQILMGCIIYQEPNEEFFPQSLAELFPVYLDNERVLACPQSPPVIRLKNGMMTSYRYIGRFPFRDVGPDTIVIYDRIPHNGRRNAGHFDGHVAAYDEMMFKQLLDEQYDEMKPLIEADDWPGNKEQATAFYEDRDYNEE